MANSPQIPIIKVPIYEIFKNGNKIGTMYDEESAKLVQSILNGEKKYSKEHILNMLPTNEMMQEWFEGQSGEYLSGAIAVIESFKKHIINR